MKYKPRQTNFEEFSDEVVGRILEAKATIEDVKDAIAKEIDEYVDAVFKEHLESANVFVNQTAPRPVICFSLGEDNKADGSVDLFYKDVSLEEILDGLDPEEFEESEDAIKVAEMLEEAAVSCRTKASVLLEQGQQLT